ncbi:MAG: hypothetical protein JXR51_05080 [Bacteroidales bacterium]|nr:hypothetical protein [Bacteroidales bacterium]MBN2756533.1 hypothetical protein [Bacteroidales bacterium]
MVNDKNISRGCNSNFNDESNLGCQIGTCNKLNVYDWLSKTPEGSRFFEIVEVRFKNTRKAFFKNVNRLKLKQGEVVAVEASPGHDIGTVSLTGQLVLEQLNKNNVSPDYEFKKLYRKAKPVDIEKWEKSIEKEFNTMIKARQITENLGLNMKIGDVEYQGDGTKAIFYYIADERVDFRELIKILAEEFRIRVEMKQIGARQEAGRIGGIGSCGRELCCSTWITNFVSVTTLTAKYQELSLNPQKLAGQCGKLKCCLNFESDSYLDAQKDFPDTSIILKTKKGDAFHQKTDIYKKIMWYSFNENSAFNLTAVPVDRVLEIIKLNKENSIVESLVDAEEKQFKDILSSDQTSDNERVSLIGKQGQESIKQKSTFRKKMPNKGKFRSKK